MRDITELITFLKNNYCTKEQLQQQGWSTEEIAAAQTFSENVLRPQPDKSRFWAGVLIPLLLVGIVVAEELPPTIQEWIDSNGTKGSPVFVESGDDVTLIGTTNASLVRSDNVSEQAGSNPEAPINVNVTLVNSTLQNVTESYNATFPTTNQTERNLTALEALSELKPMIQVYSNENNTAILFDNNQTNAVLRWALRYALEER